MTGVLDRIGAARIVPVLRAPSAAEARAVAERLLDGGLDVIELTTTIPGWPDLLRGLTAEHPGASLGVGTLRTPADAAAAANAGAAFGVTPHPVAGARDALVAAGVPLVEGGFTPAEVLSAADHGVAKLFPAHVGGVPYLRSLLALAPAARIVPTGGIPLADVRTWLDAGAFAVGVGGDLSTGDVATRVQDALAA